MWNVLQCRYSLERSTMRQPLDAATDDARHRQQSAAQKFN
jgi:hypothetical protein